MAQESPRRSPREPQEGQTAREAWKRPLRGSKRPPRGPPRVFQEAPKRPTSSTHLRKTTSVLTISPFRVRWAVRPQAEIKASADIPRSLSGNMRPTTTTLIFVMAPLMMTLMIWRRTMMGRAMAVMTSTLTRMVLVMMIAMGK